MMKKHYYKEINKGINNHHKYVFIQYNHFTLRYCEWLDQKKQKKICKLIFEILSMDVLKENFYKIFDIKKYDIFYLL